MRTKFGVSGRRVYFSLRRQVGGQVSGEFVQYSMMNDFDGYHGRPQASMHQCRGPWKLPFSSTKASLRLDTCLIVRFIPLLLLLLKILASLPLNF